MCAWSLPSSVAGSLYASIPLCLWPSGHVLFFWQPCCRFGSGFPRRLGSRFLSLGQPCEPGWRSAALSGSALLFDLIAACTSRQGHAQLRRPQPLLSALTLYAEHCGSCSSQCSPPRAGLVSSHSIARHLACDGSRHGHAAPDGPWPDALSAKGRRSFEAEPALGGCEAFVRSFLCLQLLAFLRLACHALPLRSQRPQRNMALRGMRRSLRGAPLAFALAFAAAIAPAAAMMPDRSVPVSSASSPALQCTSGSRAHSQMASPVPGSDVQPFPVPLMESSHALEISSVSTEGHSEDVADQLHLRCVSSAGLCIALSALDDGPICVIFWLMSNRPLTCIIRVSVLSLSSHN